MNEQELRQYFERVGLQRVVGAALHLARPSIRVETLPRSSEALPIGASRMGGWPDLPPGTAYPVWHEPMRFLGQFNLASLVKYDLEKMLPPFGLLLFFYETDGEPLYSERLAGLKDDQVLPREEKIKGWRVLYFKQDPSTFERCAAPDGSEPLYPNCALRFRNTLTLPDADGPECAPLRLTTAERTAWIQAEAIINRGDIGHHQMLGYPYNFDGPAFLDAAGSADQWRLADPVRRREMETAANSRWQLLLRVDSSNNLEMDWAGGGFLQYVIERDRLRAGDFSFTWLDMRFL